MTPPRHRVDAAIQYIERDDPAWNLDKVHEETEGLDGDELQGHPWVQYLSGATRFDLEPVRHLLREEATPRTWTLRRLKVTEVSLCLDKGGRRGDEWAFRLAARGLEGCEIEGLKFPSKGRMLDEVYVEAIAAGLGVGVIHRVGAAALAASQMPTVTEKKR